MNVIDRYNNIIIYKNNNSIYFKTIGSTLN